MAEKTMEPIIEFKHVSKRYKLYSGNRQRLASVFFKNLNIKTKDNEWTYETTVTNTSSLAQTGQYIWPIPVLATAGILFLLLALYIKIVTPKIQPDHL